MSSEARTAEPVQLTFTSHGVRCGATLYAPLGSSLARPRARFDQSDRGPGIVMAAGLGGERHVGLPPYARRFAEAGYWVLTFDYRYWGSSEGQPRHLVSLRRQVEDWRAAVAFLRTLPEVDSEQVALWGSSMSGGHVICVAAADPSIAAVSAQCPMMDGRAASLAFLRSVGLRQGIKLSALGLLDVLRSVVGLSPIYVPTVARRGELALMASEDAWAGVQRLLAESGVPAQPEPACARVTLELGRYRPITYAKRVACPTLIVACEQDTVAPFAAAAATAEALGEHGKLVSCSFGHFDLYVDQGFEFSFAQELAFFDGIFKRNSRIQARLASMYK